MEEDPRAVRTRDNDRVLRRWLALLGAPLALVVLVPFPAGREELLFPWEFSERAHTLAPLLLPAIGGFLALIAAVKPIPPRARALLALVGVVAFASIALDLVTAPAIWRELSHELRRISQDRLFAFAAAPLMAVTAEHVMQLDKSSRLRAIAAIAFWLYIDARFFFPMQPDRIESMPFLVMTEAFADIDRDPENLLYALPLLVLFLTAPFAALLAFVRAVSAKAKMPLRRFRTGCMAYTLGLFPVVLLGGFLAIFAVAEAPHAIFAAVVCAAYLAAVLVLMPVGIAHGCSAFLDASGELFRDARSGVPRERRNARRILGAIAVALVALVAWRVYRFVGPDPRDAAARDYLEEAASAVVASTMNQPFDQRFLGGYSEFDLRGSLGALADVVGPTASVEVEATVLRVYGAGDGSISVNIVLLDGGAIRFTELSADSAPWAELGVLERAAPVLAEEVERVIEGVTGVRCVPTLSAGELERFPVAARIALGDVTQVGERCAEFRQGSSELDAARAGTDTLLVIVRANDRWLALESHLFTAEGRAWIGRATVTPL